MNSPSITPPSLVLASRPVGAHIPNRRVFPLFVTNSEISNPASHIILIATLHRLSASSKNILLPPIKMLGVSQTLLSHSYHPFDFWLELVYVAMFELNTNKKGRATLCPAILFLLPQ
jgi:hypothetical protein